MGVRIRLISSDVALAQCCREILAELFGEEWDFASAARAVPDSTGNLCIWDHKQGQEIPQDFESLRATRHCFLLERSDLAAFQTLIAATGVSVLLKPVTRASLRALLRAAGGNASKSSCDSAQMLDLLRIERDEILRFLIQANFKVQVNEQERSNFLARSVHDFRAPLTALRGYCGLLLEEELGPLTPEQRRVLERMLHSASRLARTSDGMFQLSMPQGTDPGLNLERADLRDCLDQALRELALPLGDKRISVVVEMKAVADRLMFEKAMVEQTLINLLDNACKFTPRDGMIEIRGYPFFWERRTRQAASLDLPSDRRTRQVAGFNSYRVDIRDSGPGISAGHVDRIFEQDTSYGGSQDRSGGGLGLAICRRILTRHGGRIWAESSQSGALFSFVLPFLGKGTASLEGDASADSSSFVETLEG